MGAEPSKKEIPEKFPTGRDVGDLEAPDWVFDGVMPDRNDIRPFRGVSRAEEVHARLPPIECLECPDHCPTDEERKT